MLRKKSWKQIDCEKFCNIKYYFESSSCDDLIINHLPAGQDLLINQNFQTAVKASGLFQLFLSKISTYMAIEFSLQRSKNLFKVALRHPKHNSSFYKAT